MTESRCKVCGLYELSCARHRVHHGYTHDFEPAEPRVREVSIFEPRRSAMEVLADPPRLAAPVRPAGPSALSGQAPEADEPLFTGRTVTEHPEGVTETQWHLSDAARKGLSVQPRPTFNNNEQPAVSEQAWALARQICWPYLAGQDITWLAAALQKLMDERDEARRVARILAQTVFAAELPTGVGLEVATALAYPEVPHG